jgi:hypothetical protein
MVSGVDSSFEVPMNGTRRASGASGTCDGRGRHRPGLEWMPDGIGPVMTEAATVWDAIREGRSVTLLCEDCGALLTTRLEIQS